MAQRNILGFHTISLCSRDEVGHGEFSSSHLAMRTGPRAFCTFAAKILPGVVQALDAAAAAAHSLTGQVV